MAVAALIDAGPLIAAGNRRDRRHTASVRFLDGFEGTLLTTWAVLTEVCQLMPQHAVVRFVRSVSRGSLEVHDVPQEALAKIADLMEKYADLPMDLADASLLWLAEKMGIRDIVTFDERDFVTYRLAGGKRFNNLIATRRR
jgi:hypothetical protein